MGSVKGEVEKARSCDFGTCKSMMIEHDLSFLEGVVLFFVILMKRCCLETMLTAQVLQLLL